ncbi:hypothetical protein GCM10007108_16270 [Thermogymnomonas acidicola]|uniref:Uncharacterized protein n=1 Tax=Thermogymnomonas acidicola TaxID=399579 RepID=A0AA37BTN9_9ARCH|nr:hypothetical protein GCM10007108_16270 [Thermogymnomonas acidicola]
MPVSMEFLEPPAGHDRCHSRTSTATVSKTGVITDGLEDRIRSGYGPHYITHGLGTHRGLRQGWELQQRHLGSVSGSLTCHPNPHLVRGRAMP